MQNKLLPIFSTLAAILNLSVYVAAQETKNKGNEQTTINKGYELAKLLPDSDVVIKLKLSEILRKTFPQFLSTNHQPLLTKIKDDINKIKADNRGLDLRDVENVAVGFKFNPDAKNNPDLPEFAWSALFQSRDKIDSKVPILMAKRNGKYHQEKIGNHTIYIIQKLNEKKSSDKSDKNKPNKSKIKKYPYCAVASYGNDIIAMGSPGHVKKTIGESQKVSTNILDLLNRKPAAVITFGAYFPKGFSPYIDFKDSDLDGLDAAIGSIRQVQGSLDINERNAFISVVMETSDVKNAKFLHDLLVTGRLFLKTRLNKLMNANDPEWNYLKEMTENSEVSQDGKKVMLSLKVTENAFGFLLKEFIEGVVYSKEKGKGC